MTEPRTIRIISPQGSPWVLGGKTYRVDDGSSELPAGAYVLTLQVLDEAALTFNADRVTIRDELDVLIIDTQQVAW